VSKLRALTMPKWGIEMVEGTIAEWRIAAGDQIKKGQLLALIETDKIANDLEGEFEATVARVVAEAGSVYPVGALLAVLATEAADAAEIEDFVRNFRAAAGSAAAETQSAEPTVAAATAAPVAAAPPPPPAAPKIPKDANISPAARNLADSLGLGLDKLHGSGRRGRITLQDVDQASKPAVAAPTGKPTSVAVTTAALDSFHASAYAKRLAVQRSVDLAKLKGTGPRGRISRADVLKVGAAAGAAAGAPAAPAAAPFVAVASGAAEFTVEKFTPMRKAIARQLTLSKSTIPHFYLRMRIRVDALSALRERIRKDGGKPPSVNDYLIRAAALALIEIPQVNIQVHGEEVHVFKHADVAVAVATDRGLITPIVRSADLKPVAQIGAEIRDLAERARAGKLKTEEYSGGSFCVTNLGMFGIDEFDAIINPPQGAILAVGALQRQFVEDAGSVTFANTLKVSLSCDHRAIDGAVGARFLSALRDLIETPQRLVS
jgi:pyruvate dehydrogenase E2 component (dihydrolipoamide acetyltransferase)